LPATDKHILLRVTFAALIIAAIAGTAAAQVNTEKLRSKDDSLGVFGAVALSLNYKTGNTEFLDYGITGRVDYMANSLSLFVIGEYKFISKDNDPFSRRGFYHIRMSVPVYKSLVWELFGQEENNRSTNLKQRWLAGTGVRITAYDDNYVHATIGTAYMFEYEELSQWEPGIDNPLVRVHRWSNYIVMALSIDDRLTLRSTTYLQPRFTEFHDFRILEEASLIFKLSSLLSFSNTFILRHDSEPPAGIEHTDISLETGISLSF
jgi:Protein of unknown function, DUF481